MIGLAKDRIERLVPMVSIMNVDERADHGELHAGDRISLHGGESKIVAISRADPR